MVYVFAILLCVALDQAVKLFTVARLDLYEAAPLLPGIVELRYIQNTGGGQHRANIQVMAAQGFPLQNAQHHTGQCHR